MNFEDSQETELIERAAGGDSGAFDQLVCLHQSKLRYSLRQLTGWDESWADDIAQETFIRAYRSLASFRSGSKFSTWLYRIAYNEFVDQSRKRKSTQSMSTESVPEFEEQAETPTQREDLHRDLARAMLALSEEQRAALHLSLHRQYTQAEVADVMGCPIGTAKSHILRGKEKLQEVLADWREEVST